jgi:PIN domain nuclease of toxin-antitoxin system
VRILLDTHIILWIADGGERLSKRAAALIADPGNDRIVSHVSLWELAIKRSIGKLAVSESDIEQVLVDIAADELPIERRHVLATASLPLHHRDPFDRLLIAQAKAENLVIASADSEFAAYGVDLLPA